MNAFTSSFAHNAKNRKMVNLLYSALTYFSILPFVMQHLIKGIRHGPNILVSLVTKCAGSLCLLTPSVDNLAPSIVSDARYLVNNTVCIVLITDILTRREKRHDNFYGSLPKPNMTAPHQNVTIIVQLFHNFSMKKKEQI